MSFFARSASPSERPTLPPLHSLDLFRGHPSNDSNNVHARQPPYHPRHRGARQFSGSSSTTSSSSRTPSPSPSNFTTCSSVSSAPTSPPSSPRVRMRLVPSTFEQADAVIVIPPPNASHNRSLPSLSPITSLSNLPSTINENEKSSALLLLGPSIRHPNRQIARGSRMHPYRIVKTSGRKGSRDLEVCI